MHEHLSGVLTQNNYIRSKKLNKGLIHNKQKASFFNCLEDRMDNEFNCTTERKWIDSNLTLIMSKTNEVLDFVDPCWWVIHWTELNWTDPVKSKSYVLTAWAVTISLVNVIPGILMAGKFWQCPFTKSREGRSLEFSGAAWMRVGVKLKHWALVQTKSISECRQTVLDRSKAYLHTRRERADFWGTASVWNKDQSSFHIHVSTLSTIHQQRKHYVGDINL